MKIAKMFTQGLALLLALLIIIYLLTCYVKYNPKEEKLEEKSKLELYLEEKKTTDVYYLWLAVLLCISAAVGLIMPRFAEVIVFVSVLPTAYALTLYTNSSLATRPMAVILPCVMHTLGTVVYAAAEERSQKRNICAGAGILCALGGLAVTTVCAVFQKLALSVADEVAELKEASLTVSPKLQCFPTLVRMVWGRYAAGEDAQASEMLSDFERNLDVQGSKMFLYRSIDPEQFTVYVRLALIFFAVAVLWFAFRGKLRLPAAVLSFLPIVLAFHQLQNDRLSAMPMVILAFALMTGLCGFVSFEQGGREPVSAFERRIILEELAEPRESDPLDTDGRDEYGKPAPETPEDEIEYDR